MWLKPYCANFIITIIEQKQFRFFIFMKFASFSPLEALS